VSAAAASSRDARAARGAEERYAVAVDLGTGGPKVGVVSLSGEILWSEHLRIRTRYLPDGGAVQDAEEWWQVVTGSISRALRRGAVDTSRVVALSCTGQWASTVPVGEDGAPVGDCVMWMDRRGGPHSRRRFGGAVSGYSALAITRFVRRSGGAPSIWGADPIGHILYLGNDLPVVSKRARWYMEPVDYLSMRFTGVPAATHASMTAAWLTDNRHQDRLDYDSTLIRAAGVPVEKLPPLLPTGSVIGEVLESVGRELGLPPSVKVVTGTPDLHSAAVGSGGGLDYQAHTVISTTSWTSCPVPKKKTDPVRQVASIPGLEAGHYLVVDNQETAGLCLEWLRDNFVAPQDALSVAMREAQGAPGAAAGVPTLDELTSLAATAPPGSGGVIFTPWLSGERSPVDDRHVRGGFHNLSLRTSRAELVRSLLEGVAYNNRWLNRAVERFVGRRLEPLRIIGGGAQSDLWCQIHADVLGRRLERVAEPLHASLRGAGMWAGLALGAIHLEDLSHLVPVDARFEPDPGRGEVYERLYAEFPKLYKSEKPIFARLNRGRS